MDKALRAFSREDREDWRRHPVTAAFLQDLFHEQEAKLEMLAMRARAGSIDEIRVLGGAIEALAAVSDLATHEGSDHGED